MPSYTRNKPKEIVSYVRMSASQEIYYGWKTKDFTELPGISAADLVALGHIQFNNLPAAALYFFRASAPKPARMRKQLIKNPTAAQQGSINTFVAIGNLSAAFGEGWTLAHGQQRVSLTKNSRTTTAIATLSNGLLYAFPMNTDDFNTFGTELGLQDSTTINTNNELERLISGTKNPIPGKATKLLAGGAKMTSFFASDQLGNLAANNWSVISAEVVTT